MSTICKLAPQVRKARYYRREALVSLQRVIRQLTAMGNLTAAARAGVVCAALNEVRLDPTITGEQKSLLFSRAMNQLGGTT